MATANSINENVIKQLEFALSDIAETAACLRRICLDMGQHDDAETLGYQSGAAQRLAERIGYIADLCQENIGDGLMIWKGSAEKWMMSPAYHSAKNSAEVGHG